MIKGTPRVLTAVINYICTLKEKKINKQTQKIKILDFLLSSRGILLLLTERQKATVEHRQFDLAGY